MRIVALAQQKGGVGKSAAAINLSCEAARDGARAVLIDMDHEQGTVLRWGRRRETDNPEVSPADSVSLPGLLGTLRGNGTKWAFIDLPGRSAAVAGAGMKEASMVLIPCRPSDVDIEASVDTVQRLKRAGRRYAYLMNIAPPYIDKVRARAVMAQLEKLGHPVCPVIIVQRIEVPDAIAIGKAACEFTGAKKSADEFAALFQWLKAELRNAR